MLVLESNKTVLLNLKHPNKVLTTIPTAKEVTLKGKSIVVAPHCIDETKVLRRLGIRVPAPILYYYDYKATFKAIEYQKMTAAFLTMNKKCLVLNSIGTGKTISTLWAADYLMKIGLVKKVLIVAPLSTLDQVWSEAIFINFYERTSVILYGTRARRLKLLDTDVDFYIINFEGFNTIAKEAKGKFDITIIDEAAILRNPSTRKFRTMKKWTQEQSNMYLWLLTATPTPNRPTDAWALAKLIDSPYLTMSFTAFQDMVMLRVGKWKLIPRINSAEVVKNILQPAIRYTRDECSDLPDTVFQTRTVELTKEQKKHYKQMLKDLVIECNEGKVVALNEAIKKQKLVQISCGIVYGEDGSLIQLECTPRVNLVKELIEQAGEKVIIFVHLKSIISMLSKILSKLYSVAVINGDVSVAERNLIFNNFQKLDDPHVLIAHPGTMAHGLTLTAASTIIWYAPIFSNEQYIQANGRVERLGKKHKANVVNIEATHVEHNIYNVLKNKQQFEGSLLDLIREDTEEYL